MVFRALILASALIPTVLAGKGTPQLSVGIRSDAIGKDASPLAILEPNLKYDTPAYTIGGCELEGGLNCRIVDEKTLPYSLWGKVKKSIEGINLSARADVASSNLQKLSLDLQADAGTTKVQMKASADLEAKNVDVSTVKVTQDLDGLGGAWTVMPQFHVKSKKADVKVSYSFPGATVIVDASQDSQKLTVGKLIGDNNRISPSITTDGDFEIAYRRNIGSGALTTTVKPDAFVSLKWEEGPLTASLVAPMEGMTKFTDGVKVGVRRTVF